MKFTKMSLVAALLIGSSAFAIENTKISGTADLFYATSDAGSKSLFDKDNSAADAAINLNVTTDLVSNSVVSISAGAGYTVLTTLGLENNLVSNVWGGAHPVTAGTDASFGSALGGVKVENANWMTEAWVAATAGNTTLKLGRMELDTPLAFTETWSIEKNTFEAIVAINQDLPDTTLVGAYVGNGNGTENFGQTSGSTVATLGHAIAPVVNEGGKFTTYGTDGAYAAGIINNSFKPLTVQAWYYDVVRLAEAYWLQADLNMEGILAGAQYSSVEASVSGASDDNVYAFMLGYEMKDVATVKLSYSSVNEDGSIGYAGFNTATNIATAQSKLYTEAWWNYGHVTQSGTDAINFTAEGNVANMVDLGLYITSIDHKEAGADLDEYTLTASKSFGPLDTTAAVVYTDPEVGDAETIVQAYLTLNF